MTSSDPPDGPVPSVRRSDRLQRRSQVTPPAGSVVSERPTKGQLRPPVAPSKTGAARHLARDANRLGRALIEEFPDAVAWDPEKTKTSLRDFVFAARMLPASSLLFWVPC